MRNSIYAIAAVFWLLLAVGCDTLAGPEAGHGARSDGRVAVSLALTGTGGRSVSPTLPNAARWRLRGGKTGESPDWLTDLFADPDDQTLYLEIGAWDFTLEGYEDETGGRLILKGTLEGQTISLGRPNILSFDVAPLAEGEGFVHITIKLPPGHGIDRVAVLTGNNREPELDPPVTFEEDTIVFATGHKAGDFYFSFRLYKGANDLYGVVSELVKVRLNLTSEETYTLDPEDLNLLYIISYHLNYGEPGLEFGYYRYTDSGLLQPPSLRPGYDFKGWHSDAGLQDKPVTEISPATSTGDRDFYAEWKAIKYAIIYQPDDEEIDYGDNPTEYTVEDEVILADPPEREGFRFDGWHSDIQLLSPIINPAIPKNETEDKTFYAKWTHLYTVSFETDGGSPVEPITEDEYTPADKPDIPTKASHRFLGWFDETGEIEYDDSFWSQPLTESLTMYAHWKLQHTIAFDAHDGSPVDSITQDENTTVDYEPVTNREGFEFQGWFPTDSGGEPYSWSPFYTLTESLTMHAQWIRQYTIIFNSHDGSAVPSITANVGTSVPEPKEPELSKHRFLGWFPDPSGGVAYTWDHTLIEDITMHAQWIRQYTIAFDSHEGSDVGDITRDVGTQVPIPDAPTREGGYRFMGWFAAPTGGVAHEWPHDLTGDITLHAQWLPVVTIRVTINDHDGKLLNIGQTITISKGSNGGHNPSFTATVNDYSDVQWHLNGDPISGGRGKAQSIRINARDYQNGSYYLGASAAAKGDVYYSRDIYFTVIN